MYYGLDIGKIYNSNKFVYVKFRGYFRDLYYNGVEELDESRLWLVLFTSRSFSEMYDILGKFFDDDRREQFIRKVFNMIDGRKIFEDWELEQLNEFVKYKSEKNLREDALREGHAEGHAEGLKQGIEEGIEQGKQQSIHKTIENMLKEKIDIEIISRVVNKSKDEILEIKKSLGL